MVVGGVTRWKTSMSTNVKTAYLSCKNVERSSVPFRRNELAPQYNLDYSKCPTYSLFTVTETEILLSSLASSKQYVR